MIKIRVEALPVERELLSIEHIYTFNAEYFNNSTNPEEIARMFLEELRKDIVVESISVEFDNVNIDE